jgi:CDP-glycerol glycerophosphotransferase (TagB/SpsB family)
MLLTQDISLTIKPQDHYVGTCKLAAWHGVRVERSQVDPIDLILEHDVVVTDYSAVVFDALAVRKPVVLMNTLDMGHFAAEMQIQEDHLRSAICGLAGVWTSKCTLREAFEYSLFMLRDDIRFRDFLQKYFVNIGCAGLACAREIEELAKHGEKYHFVVQQVRDATRDCSLPCNQPGTSASTARTRQLYEHGLHLGRGTYIRAIRSRLGKLPAAARLVAYIRTLRHVEQTKDCNDNAAPGLAWSLPVVPRERRQAMLTMIEALLSDHGLDYRTCITGSKAYCAVAESDLDEVCQALNALGRQIGAAQVRVWFGSKTSYDDVCFAESLSLANMVQADSMIVGVPYQGRQGQARSGGAEILIVEQRSGRVVARRQRADKVDWTSDFVEGANRVEPGDIHDRTSRGKLHALEGEPIDVVYTWVDSADPQWEAERQEWANLQNTELDSADNDERYLDRDELRYSLRSLWLYAPFVRNIFIVTAGHYPRWLDVTHNNIHVIPHSLIFPRAEDLPTFNSHAIEACLHRIPGLAEHFVYFNDDVFLGQETTVNTFFTKGGLMKSRLSTTASIPAVRPDMTATPTDWASYNAAAVICRDFAIRFNRKVKHVPMPMKRSLLNEIEERYQDLFTTTRAARFRSQSDLAIPSMLAHFYGISVAKAVEWEHVAGEYIYADTGRNDFESKLSAITNGSATFFCLNATRYSEIALRRQALLLRKFFEKTYPIPSPYEIYEVQ